MQETQKAILFVDKSTEISFESGPQIAVKHVLEGKKAQAMLADREQAIAGVFIHPKLEDISFISVVKMAALHRPSVPVYLVKDPDETLALSDQELRRIGIREKIERSKLNYRSMLELVAPLAISFDARIALEKAKSNLDKSGQEVVGQDSQFVAIRAEDFVSGSKSLFDVYVKIGSGKHVKLLDAGDSFQVERLESYLRKGVTHFYMRKEVQEEYLNYCDHIASSVLKSDKISMDVKTSQILNQGEETIGFLKNHGVSEKNLKHAAKFVENVRTLVQQMDLGQNELARGFLANVGAYEHGVGTAALCAILSQELEIEMSKPVQIVGFAAMFHDLGLISLPERFWPGGQYDEDITKMTPEDRKMYETHPEIGANALRKIKGVEAAAAQAVEQHHMRTKGTGFPEKTGMGQLNRVSEIVAICDEFNVRIKRATKKGAADSSRGTIISELEREVFPYFSRQIVYAFRTAFFSSVKA